MICTQLLCSVGSASCGGYVIWRSAGMFVCCESFLVIISANTQLSF